MGWWWGTNLHQMGLWSPTCVSVRHVGNRSVSAEEAGPFWSQQIRFLHLASQICTVPPRPVHCLLNRWGLTAGTVECVTAAGGAAGTEVTVLAARCSVPNRSFTGLNLGRDTCCLSSRSHLVSLHVDLHWIWILLGTFMNSALILWGQE